MVERRPAGFNVDLAFPDSKEVMSIPARYRNAAVGLWTRCGAWAASKLTDGYVPAEVIKAYGGTRQVVDALVASTLWKPADYGAVWFTNWPRWQRTRGEVTAYRQADAERKRAARAARVDATQTLREPHVDLTQTSRKNSGDPAQTSRKDFPQAPTSTVAETSDRTTPGRGLRVRPESRNPSTKYLVKEGGTRELSAVGSGPPPPPAPAEFPAHCADHRHNPDPPACGPCRDRRLELERSAQQQADIESVKRIADRDKRRRRIAECQQCDELGWQLDMWGEPLEPAIKCNHPGIT